MTQALASRITEKGIALTNAEDVVDAEVVEDGPVGDPPPPTDPEADQRWLDGQAA